MGFPFQTAAKSTFHTLAFDSLRLGKNSQTICARLLRFWNSDKFSSYNHFNGITLTFVDYKGSMVNGLLPDLHAAKFFPLLQENTIYNFSYFEVAQCPPMYKTTEHPYVIRFLEQTILEPLKDNSSVIQSQQFMVRTYDQLQMLADTHLELPDVFGCIKSVKSYGLNIADVHAPVLLRLQISREVALEIVLLEPAAAVFRRLLNSPDEQQCAMLFTSVNPKRIGGRLCLISTIGTRFYYGEDLSALTHITGSLVLGQVHDPSLLDVRPTVNTSHIDTIGDLSSFLTDTEFKDPLFSCKARIVDIIYPRGWFTVICGSCAQPLPCSSAEQACTQTSPSRVVRYQVELLVDDGQHYAVFKVDDKDIFGLIKQEASSFSAQGVLNANDSILPPALEHLRGGVFVFHVLTAASDTVQSSPFNVVGISELTESDYDPTTAPSLMEEALDDEVIFAASFVLFYTIRSSNK